LRILSKLKTFVVAQVDELIGVFIQVKWFHSLKILLAKIEVLMYVTRSVNLEH